MIKYINKTAIIATIAFSVTCTNSNKTKEVMNQRKYMYMIGTGLFSLFTQTNAENTTSIVSNDAFPDHQECHIPSYTAIFGTAGFIIWGCSMWSCFLYGKITSRKHFIKPEIQTLKGISHDNELKIPPSPKSRSELGISPSSKRKMELEIFPYPKNKMELEISPSPESKMESIIQRNKCTISSSENYNTKKKKDPFSELRNSEIVFSNINNNQFDHNADTFSIPIKNENDFKKCQSGNNSSFSGNNNVNLNSDDDDDVLQGIETIYKDLKKSDEKQKSNQNELVATRNHGKSILQNIIIDNLVEVTNSYKMKKEHKGYVMCVAFSPFSPEIALSGGTDNTVRIWNINKLTSIILGMHDDVVFDVKFSPFDDDLIASSSKDGFIKLWNLKEKNLRKKLCIKKDTGITCLDFSPTTKKLLLTGDTCSNVILWNLDIEEQVYIYGKHTSLIRSVTFSPINQYQLASGSKDMRIIIHDLKKTTHRAIYDSYEVRTLDFSSFNEHILVSGGKGKDLMLWDLRTNRKASVLKGHNKSVNVAKFSLLNNHQIFSGGSGKRILCWDIRTLKVAMCLKGHTRYVTSLDPSPFYKKAIISGSSDECVRYWHLP